MKARPRSWRRSNCRGQVDSRTDVYALGCLAYELLTGRQLYRATNLFELVQQKLTIRLPPAAQIGGGVSGELYDFLGSAPCA